MRPESSCLQDGYGGSYRYLNNSPTGQKGHLTMSATPEVQVQVQEITIPMTLAEVAAAVRGVGGAEAFAVEVSKAAQAAAELFDIALQGAMIATFRAIGNGEYTIAALVAAVKADAEANGTKAVGKTQLTKYNEAGRLLSLKGSWNPAGDTVETVKAARLRTLIEQAYNAAGGRVTVVRAAIVGTQGEAVKALKALIEEAAAAKAAVAEEAEESAPEADEADEAVSFDAAIFALKQAVDAAFAAMPEESTKEQVQDIYTLVADIQLLAQQVGELSAVTV